MDWIQILGLVAATCTTLSFLPQSIRVIKTRNTHSISLTMYSFFSLGVSLWLIYGFLIGDLPVILANVITLFFAVIILFYKIKHG